MATHLSHFSDEEIELLREASFAPIELTFEDVSQLQAQRHRIYRLRNHVTKLHEKLISPKFANLPADALPLELKHSILRNGEAITRVSTIQKGHTLIVGPNAKSSKLERANNILKKALQERGSPTNQVEYQAQQQRRLDSLQKEEHDYKMREIQGKLTEDDLRAAEESKNAMDYLFSKGAIAPGQEGTTPFEEAPSGQEILQKKLDALKENTHTQKEPSND